jgi:hypothetical protein
MSKTRASERSDINMGDAGERRSDAPMQVGIYITTAATPTATGATIFEPMERYRHGKRRRKSEAPATAFAPREWRRFMQRSMRQQA